MLLIRESDLLIMQSKLEGQQIDIPFKCPTIHSQFYRSFKISLEI